MKIVLTTLTIIALTGCSSTTKIESHAKIIQSQMQACVTKEVARYAALVEIAKTGDSTAKVAAIMSMQQLDSCQNIKSKD